MTMPTTSTSSAGASAAAPAVQTTPPPSASRQSSASAPPVDEKKPATIRQYLQRPAFAAEIAKALPKHLTPDRFLRVAMTALTKTPKLADCDQGSFFSALLTLSQYGIEPDGRRAHLIPFENRRRGVIECQLIIDYKGLAELAMRSGLVSTLHADVVREGDVFDYSAGELTRHVPFFLRVDADKPKDAGAVFAVYALARFKDGTSKCEVMSLDEVDLIRKRSKSGASGPWVTDFVEMAKKTAFRRLSKWLPISAEIRDAMEADDDRYDLETMKRAVPGSSMADALGELPPMSAPSDDVPMGEGSAS